MLQFLMGLALCIFIGVTILWVIAGLWIVTDKRRQKPLSKRQSAPRPIQWGKAILLGCFLAALFEGALAFH